MIAAHVNFDPCLIQTEEDNPNLLTVQCTIGNSSVHVINGHGPQEDDSICDKIDFFSSLEKLIENCLSAQSLLCVEMEANSKIGIEYIKDDPHHTSKNGQKLLDIVSRHGLVIVNTTSKCHGTITRIRETSNGIEKSVIDYFVVCQSFYSMIIKMIVDDKREHVLTKYASAKGSKKIVESDHNPLICKLKFKWTKNVKPIRKEIFNLKD